MSPSLAELQKRIQDSVLAQDAACLDLIKPSPRDTSDTMFGVYRNAYHLRLTEFLANDHEKLKLFVGEARFRTMARAYIAVTPSDQPNARWYSRKLPEFLSEYEPYSKLPALHDLANLERALNDAFDAAELNTVTIEDLAGWAADSFADVCFAFHPSVRLIDVTSDLPALWSALREKEGGDIERGDACASRVNSAAANEPQSGGESRSAIDQEFASYAQQFASGSRTSILVCRQGATSRFRALPAEEEMALKSAQQGLAFGIICEMISVMADPESAAIRAATYLRNWIEGEMIASITLARAPATS